MRTVSQLNQLILTVDGLTCERCATSAKKALEKVPGVTEANVDLATAQATITFASDEPSPDVMMSALAARGYLGKVMSQNTANSLAQNASLVTPNGCRRISFRVTSLVSEAALQALRIALTREPGIQGAGTHRRSDDSDEGIAWAVYDPEVTDAERLRSVIRKQGYALR